MATKTKESTKEAMLKQIKDLKAEIDRLERRSQYEKMAEEVKLIFDSYLSVGFTEDQAVTLTSSTFAASAALAK